MFCRYRDVSGKYDHISPYTTPNNYSRLTRGSSLQDVGPPSSPKGGRRLWRQSSLETEGRRGEGHLRNPHHQLHHHQVETRRRERRLGSELSSGRGERVEKKRAVDCNKVTQPASKAASLVLTFSTVQICTGIIIGNGETVCDLTYLKGAGVSHVLNTAEQHVMVSQARLAAHNIQYYGFHVDDLPHCNISR